MNQQQLDHQTAVTWITTEMKIFANNIGQENASAAVRSVIDLATLLRVISIDEKREFSAEVSRIHRVHNASVQGKAA
ncbi:MAG: hypothetical protein RR517_25125 [Pseudomonas sp.]